MLCLLGEPAAFIDGRYLPLRLRPKGLALLAYLALHEREVPRRKAASLLFAESEDPLASLRWYVHHIRQALPAGLAEGLQASRTALSCTVETDVARFRHGAAHLLEGPHPSDATTILALYRGDLLEELPVAPIDEFDTWLYIEQESVRRLFRQAVTAFARWAVESGDAADTIEPLSRLVSVDPYFEEGHILLIGAHLSLGRNDHAEAAYERYQRIVREELRAEPRPSIARRFEEMVRPGSTLPLEALIPLRNVTIHVVDWPGGEPTTVGIHGSAGLAHSLAAIAENLAPDHRFIAYDLRGHGLSDKPPAGYRLEQHLEDLEQLLRELDLRHPVLLGHSAGGAIAACAASVMDVAGLILLDGMVGDRAFAENAAAQAAPLARGPWTHEGGFDVYLESWQAHRSAWRDESEILLDRFVRYALVPLRAGVYRHRGLQVAVESEWHSIIDADTLGALARVRCPVLIVQAMLPWWGGKTYFTDDIVRQQVKAAPHAQLFLARSSNHSTLIRDPEPAMMETIAAFVERCRSVAPPEQTMRHA